MQIIYFVIIMFYFLCFFVNILCMYLSKGISMKRWTDLKKNEITFRIEFLS